MYELRIYADSVRDTFEKFIYPPILYYFISRKIFHLKDLLYKTSDNISIIDDKCCYRSSILVKILKSILNSCKVICTVITLGSDNVNRLITLILYSLECLLYFVELLRSLLILFSKSTESNIYNMCLCDKLCKL